MSHRAKDAQVAGRLPDHRQLSLVAERKRCEIDERHWRDAGPAGAGPAGEGEEASEKGCGCRVPGL